MAVVGAVLITGSAVIWSRQTRELKELAATRVALEDSLGVLQAETRRTSERFMGFQKSMPSIPDSLRRYAGNKVMEVGSGYSKKLRMLGSRERDVKLKISRTHLRADAVRKRAASSSLPVGIAGLAVLIAGLVVARTANARRVGA